MESKNQVREYGMRKEHRIMRLLFVGDSLIEFFDWETRFAGHEVFNFGVAGETVEGLGRRLATITSKVSSPDFVFIMTGINNLAMDDRDFTIPYASVIERLKHAYPSARIVIHSLLPARTPFLANSEIRAMNKELSALAEREQIAYEDLYPLFLDAHGDADPLCLLEDGVHLSDEGYRIWAARIEEVIKNTADR
jgi:lysophospholipase L1-like esterase